MTKLLPLLAADFAALYRAALDERLFTPEGLTVAGFARVFDAAHTEYVHYADSTIARPFHRDVTRAVLQLAAAYLSLPFTAAPTARGFGLFLCFFLYSTQPWGAGEEEKEEKEKAKAKEEGGPGRVPVRVPVEVLRAYVDDVDAGRVGDEERRVLLAMHRAGAWNVVPCEDATPQIRALLEAHDSIGVPIVAPRVKTAETRGKVCGDEALAKRIEAYEEMRKRVGL